MTEQVPARRRSQPRTRFDSSGRMRVIYSIIGVFVVLIVIGGLAGYGVANPEVMLSVLGGGFSHAEETVPRNFRLWAIQPDGTLRFASAFFPSEDRPPVSEPYSVAGPLVDSPDDILETRYFGALAIKAETRAGSSNDSTRTYKFFTVEYDPAHAAYGVDMMVKNPPYILDEVVLPGDTEPPTSYIAMGAPPQSYYQQIVVAVAFPPGATVTDVHYVIPSASTGKDSRTVMLPYRRITINGWLVYYFDQTTLAEQLTVRIRYSPPTDATKPAPDLNLWEVDRLR